MKKSLVFILFFILCIIIFLFFDLKTNNEKNIKIAAIYKSADQIWFINEGKAAKKELEKYGIENFEIYDAKMDNTSYIHIIDEIIEKKVDGVMICIPDQSISEYTVHKLKEANIEIIAVDDGLEDKNGKQLTPWVGINGYEIGRQIGEWLANYAKENNLVDDNTGLLILTMNNVSSVVPRTRGQIENFLEIIPDFKENKIFFTDYNGVTKESYEKTKQTFSENPGITRWLVMTGNDEGAIGAVRALEKMGLNEESVVMGIGGYLAIREFKSVKSPLKAASFFSSETVGRVAAKMLAEKIVNNKEMNGIEEKTVVNGEIITKENFLEKISVTLD